MNRLQNELAVKLEQIRSSFSYVDYKHVVSVVKRGNQHKIDDVGKTHHKKLVNLGLPYQGGKLDPQDVIFNLANINLSPDQEAALSLGLNYCFNPNQLNYNPYFLSMEKLYRYFQSVVSITQIMTRLISLELNLKISHWKPTINSTQSSQNFKRK